MILTLIGLVLSFSGSLLLIIDSITSFGKPKTIFIPSKYNKDGMSIEYTRLQQIAGGYKEVKISKEELIIIISLFLLGGFLLQILDFVPQYFWIDLWTLFSTILKQ
jgi:hypothetical protein